MESWSKVRNVTDSYLKWINFHELEPLKDAPSLNHGCTHETLWREPDCMVALKKNARPLDFVQVR